MLKRKKDKKVYATIETVKVIESIPGADKVQRFKFSDAVYIGRIDNYEVGSEVLVIRSGAVIPEFLKQFIPGLRKSKKGVVRTLILKERVSDCIIIPALPVKMYLRMNNMWEKYKSSIAAGDRTILDRLLKIKSESVWSKIIKYIFE